MSSPSQQESEIEKEPVHISHGSPGWLEMISVAIFWVGAGHIAYLWVLPSLFHVFFAILIMLYYFLWIQKKNFSVFPKRFTSRVANAKIYKKLYD